MSISIVPGRFVVADGQNADLFGKVVAVNQTKTWVWIEDPGGTVHDVPYDTIKYSFGRGYRSLIMLIGS